MVIVHPWLDGLNSDVTRRKFAPTGERFLSELRARGLSIRTATIEDVREIINGMSLGKARSSAAQYAQRIKSILSYAHRLGFTAFNAGAAIRMKGGAVDRAKRIAGETEIALLIRAAPTKRDRLLLEVGYAGGLRVSELVALRWNDVTERNEGQAQLSVVGKGSKLRHVLLPAIVALKLLASRGDAPGSAPVFPSSQGGGHLTTRTVNKLIKRAAAAAGVNPAISAHWLRHAHASHALDRGASLADVGETLGHANVAATGIYLHARPDRSSGLKLDEGIFRLG